MKMDRRCKGFEEGLVSLANGEEAPEAAAHVETCETCEARLDQFKAMVIAFRTSTVSAPDDLIARATAIMPRPSPRKLLARLLGNSLQTSGARRAPTKDFALQVGADEFSIHLQYIETAKGWELLGRAPAEGWIVHQGSQDTACGFSGRFRLEIEKLDASEFVLSDPEGSTEIEVPAATELIRDGA